ncbi:efflux RND transporter periplasmic adaptor subunit [Janthinobacterium agaricidamnosum]|uniref:Efflux transporter, RND family, MFP subunit n=1 Tax=Janthinobacterium agaricidamnosum NBRC 102515 = DSM 9628 TaxID=1349767 RepID=W0V7G2_9BURK|nr:efflux RND transporter periplasmic adaptor subunit [Janthinobacterium agaricidamnosum]CDG83207.1 efflux transporter, RND family, MFP subunit [Janthinobacterium agaricidamnosum NBRC 102515 = DSM 9628]
MIVQVNLNKLAAVLVAAGLIGAGVHFVHVSPDNKAALAKAAATVPAGQVRFAPDAPQLSSLKVAALHSVALPVSEPLNGRIAYDENLTARVSSPIAGRVTAMHGEPGDIVKRGALLAVIDAPELATADADWRKAQADETYKRLAYQRAQTLFDGEVLPRKDLEAAQAGFQQAQAETRRASLRMKNLNAGGQEQGRFGLRAPLGGTIADKQINPGLEVRPDLPAPLFVISDLGHLWVMVDVPERYAGAIRAGQAVSVETDAYPGRHFDATVERVGLALDPATRRVQVRCAIANPDLTLKPEMYARVSFLAGAGSPQAVALPNTSLFVEGIYDYVFVELQPGQFEKRRVSVGLRGRDTSFITAGLRGGERVVTEGALLLNAEAASNAQ